MSSQTQTWDPKQYRAKAGYVAELGKPVLELLAPRSGDRVLRRRGIQVPNPWFFPTPKEYKSLLLKAGFKVHSIDLFRRPTRLPGDVRVWLETFSGCYLSAVPEPEHEVVMSDIVADLRASLTDSEGNWFADYVRLRFNAEKPRARNGVSQRRASLVIQALSSSP